MPDRMTTLKSITRLVPLLGMIALVAVAAGCQPTKVNTTLMPAYAGSEDDVQMEFWHRLAEKPMTSNNEAFHALLIFVDGEDSAERYYQRVDKLKRKGMLMKNFDGHANDAVSRGTMAVALLKALDLKGGVIISLFGPSPRYATRELRFRNIYPESSPNQTFSGGEFIGLIGRAQDWNDAQQAMAAAEQLPVDESENSPESDEQSAG